MSKDKPKRLSKKDIEIAKRYFKHITLNLYVNNTTAIKADEELKSWFLKEYKQLFQDPQFKILVSNTDFGVGG